MTTPLYLQHPTAPHPITPQAPPEAPHELPLEHGARRSVDDCEHHYGFADDGRVVCVLCRYTLRAVLARQAARREESRHDRP